MDVVYIKRLFDKCSFISAARQIVLYWINGFIFNALPLDMLHLKWIIFISVDFNTLFYLFYIFSGYVKRLGNYYKK